MDQKEVMIYIFELQNIIKNIHSLKEFKILFDILTQKERINDILIHKELSKLTLEVERFDLKSIQVFNGGIVYKLTNQEWFFFKQKYNKMFEGYICYRNVEYSFTIDVVTLIETIKKQIPDLSLRDLNEIKNLASFGNTVRQISNKLNIDIEKIRLVNTIYQSEIYKNFKEKFINLVINNANENEIRETLNISKKRFKYYIDSYAREIHDRVFSKKNSILEDYYPNGTIKMRCPFKEGLINGKVSIYDSNGKLFKEIDFINGQIDGSIKVYDRKNNNYAIKKVKSNTQSNNITKIENNNITEKDLYENALKLNWRVLEFIPDIYKTEENCIIAFNQNVLAIQYFPSKYRTEEVCRRAVEQNLLAFKDIPNKFKTKELSEKFFELYSKELKHVPNTCRTKEICIKAFETNKDNFRHIPNEYKSVDMCKKAVEYSGDMLAQVPKDYLNEELCLLAVKKMDYLLNMFQIV